MDEIWRQRFASHHNRLPREVVARAFDYEHGAREIWHSHEHGQLVHATQGVIRVLTKAGAWTVPPFHGFWIGPGYDHELHMVGHVHMRALYIEPQVLPVAWEQCRLIKVKPLLRELILALLDDPDDDRSRSLVTPLLIQRLLGAAQVEGCSLPLPTDKRLLKVCEALLFDPSNAANLDIWSHRTGASVRTLSRHFREETGLSFSEWRQQLRIAEAVCRLAQGHSLGHIAQELGYSNANAFGAMFKRVLGEAPSRYLQQSG